MTSVTDSPRTYWFPERDKYGRSCHRLHMAGARTVGVVVRLPKTAIEYRGDGMKYLSNDWSMDDRDQAVAYHRTLSEAKARLEAAATRR